MPNTPLDKMVLALTAAKSDFAVEYDADDKVYSLFIYDDDYDYDCDDPDDDEDRHRVVLYFGVDGESVMAN